MVSTLRVNEPVCKFSLSDKYPQKNIQSDIYFIAVNLTAYIFCVNPPNTLDAK